VFTEYVSAANLTTTANLSVTNVASINTASVSNTLSVTGNTSLSARLTVTGNATFSNVVTVTGAATLSNTLTVAGVTTLSSNVATPATVILNSVAHMFANSFTFNNSTTAANVDTVSTSTYRSYEYTVQMSDTTVTPNRFQLTKILLVHDGSTPYITEYGTVFNVSSLGTFTALVNAGNLALNLTPVTANVVVRFTRTSIV
jgi:hypothetical protein